MANERIKRAFYREFSFSKRVPAFVRRFNNFAVCFGRQRRTRESVGAVSKRETTNKGLAIMEVLMNNERRAGLEVSRRMLFGSG
jgi:hypothetical protein